MEVRVTAWSGSAAPTEQSLRLIMQEQGLRPHAWGNGPFDHYAPHSHSYDKVIYVVSGGISFGLPQEDRKIELRAGDRLDLPARTMHEAVVGDQGVVCLEAHTG
ncbi:MAG: cupin [Chloroflexota bacterium]